MSKIQQELCELLEISERKQPKEGDDRQDFLAKIVKEVADLSDKEWDELTPEAQDWYNEAADAKNANAKALPDFPDFKAPEPEKTSTRRRGGAKAEAEAPAEPKVGVVAKVTTKRGKSMTGTIVEIDDEVVVLKLGNGDEEEFDRSRVESIEVASTGKGKAKDEDEDEDGDETPAGPKVGDLVNLTTKRGKMVEGKVVELDDEVVVIETADGEEEFNRDRVESIIVKGGKVAKGKAKDEDADEGKSRRRSAKADEKPEEGKRTKSTNPAGVSVGQRIRELILDDIDADEATIAKALKKEGLEFRENTLKLNYSDAHKFLTLLKERKMLKA